MLDNPCSFLWRLGSKNTYPARRRRGTAFRSRSNHLPVAASRKDSVLGPYQTRLHHHLRLQRPVNGTPLSDLKEPPALRFVQRTLQLNGETNAVDPAFPGLAFLAIPGVNLFVTKADRDRLQRPTLAIRVHAQGYRGARPECGKQVIVRRGP